MQSSPLSALHGQVWTALAAASIAVGAFMQFPIGPVPFTMQPLFVMLAGFILGPVRGAAAMGIYILAGAIGLPVFSGGGSGFAYLFGPTGGYLAGFVLTAALCGMGGGRDWPGWVRALLWGLAGLAAAYILGVLRLMAVIDADLAKGVAVGFLPFIGPDLVKLGLAAAVYRYLSNRRLLPA